MNLCDIYLHLLYSVHKVPLDLYEFIYTINISEATCSLPAVCLHSAPTATSMIPYVPVAPVVPVYVLTPLRILGSLY